MHLFLPSFRYQVRYLLIGFAALFGTQNLLAQDYFFENFNSGTSFPATWSVVNNGPASTAWMVQQPSGTLTMNGTNYAMANGDAGGSGTFTNTSLTSPEINTANADLLLLELQQYYRDYGATNTDSAIIEVYNGTKWVKIQSWDVTTGSGTSPVSTKLNITPYKNANMKLRFRSVGAWPWYWLIDNIRVYQPSPNDLGVSVIVSPSGSCGLSATSQVKVQVFNYGSATQTSIPVSYKVGNAAPVSQTFTGSLAGNGSAEFTFSTPVDLSAPGEYLISAWTNLPNDVIFSNDSIIKKKVVKLGSSLSAVDFEAFNGTNISTLYEGWQEAAGLNATGTTSLWRKSTNAQQATLQTFTAALNLYTTNRREWIMMPSFQVNANSGLIFKAAVTNWQTPDPDQMGSDDSLNVMISTNCGLSWTRLYSFTASGPLNKELQEFVFPLAAYAGQEVKIGFVGTDGLINDPEDYDVHLDDIEIRNLLPNNLRPTAITSPISGCSPTAPVITVKVRNIGTQPQSNFPICARVNSLPPVCETYAGTLAPNAEIEYTFTNNTAIATPGDYVISVYTNLATDEERAGDTLKNYVYQNLPIISSFPYFEGFENGTGGWLPKGTGSTWALGTPAKAVIQGAGEGTRSYVTGGLGLGKYNNNEKSFLLSPCMNFTGIQAPIIEMKIWWHTEFNRDGIVLQGSINDGVSWFNIGQVGDILNWYNFSNITGLSGLASNRSGWTGGLGDNNGSGGWITVRNRLGGVGNISNVKLRIAFGSDGVNSGDGVAIDAIRIYNQPANDVNLSAILTPEKTGCGATATSSVRVRVRNVGTVNAVNIPVACSLNGGTPVTGVVPGPIAPNADTTFTFPTTLNMGGAGPFSLSAWTALPGDGFSGNDSIRNYLITKKIGLTDTVKFAGFDGINLASIQPGWSEAYGVLPAGTTSGWRQTTFLQGLKLGSSAARINMFGIVRNDWIVSPSFQLQAYPVLKFSVASTRLNDTTATAMGSDDVIYVKVTEDCGATWVTLRTLTKDSSITKQMKERSVDLSAYEGKNIRIAFHAYSGTVADAENYDLHLDNIYIKSVSPADGGVAAILSPNLSCGLTNTTQIQVVVSNYGTNPISNFPVRYQIGNQPPVSQNYNQTLTAGQSANFTFTQTADLSSVQNYPIKAWTGLEGDVLGLNDSSKVTVAKVQVPSAPINLVPYIGNNLGEVNIGWNEATGASTPAIGNSFWSGGTYQNQACLKFDMRGATRNEWVLSPGVLMNAHGGLAFDMAAVTPGTNLPGVLDIDDSISVLVSTNCGSSWSPVFVVKKNMVDAPNEAFKPYLVDLNGYPNQELRIAMKASDGIRIDDTSDVFITNVRFQDLTNVSGTVSDLQALSLYPNPAKDKLFLSGLAIGSRGRVEIRDVLGKLVTTVELDTEAREVALNVNHLTSGAYFVRFFDKHSKTASKPLTFLRQ